MFMLDYNIINNKPLITINGEQCLDLLSATYKMTGGSDLRPIIVNKYYVARPDLISFAIYGDDRYADIICKFNGISNPFEMNEDMLIYLPSIEWLNQCIDTKDGKSQLVENDDTDTIQNVDKNNFQKRIDESRSPNEQTIGESNYVIDKTLGIVFY